MRNTIFFVIEIFAVTVAIGCGSSQYNGIIYPEPAQNGQTIINYTTNGQYSCSINPGGQVQSGISKLYCWGNASGMGLSSTTQASLFATYAVNSNYDDAAQPSVAYFNSGICFSGAVYSGAAVPVSANGNGAPTSGPWTDTYCWQTTSGNSYAIPATMFAATTESSTPGPGVFVIESEFTFAETPPIGSATNAAALLAGGVISNSGYTAVSNGSATCTLSGNTYSCGSFTITLQ